MSFRFLFGIIALILLFHAAVHAAGFEDQAPGDMDDRTTSHGDWKLESGRAAIVRHPGNASRIGVHLFGRPESSLVLTLPEPTPLRGFRFDFERWSSTPPFKLFVEIREARPDAPWRQVFSLDEKTTVGRKPLYDVSFEKTTVAAVRFRCDALDSYGVILAEMILKKAGPMTFLRFLPEATHPIAMPILIRGGDETIFQAAFETEGTESPLVVQRIKVQVEGSDQIESMKLRRGDETLIHWVPTEGENVFPFKIPARSGENLLRLCVTAKPTATVGAHVTAFLSELVVDDRTMTIEPARMPISATRRIGFQLVKPKDHGVLVYRIPGLATTNRGTLIAVYDLRYVKGDDLPNDIDIGMSRSTDGGQTWEPVRNIMDFGGHDLNEGVGDPAILVDRETDRIWVGALWAHKGISNFNSAPGMKLGKSGQFAVTTSDDDGLTWSEPVNLTPQVADRTSDKLIKAFFDGPGAGITMRDGTLVFPAQFSRGERKIEALGGHYGDFTAGCFATILRSKDRGKTWTLGKGVRPKTTEAQVVELNDGSLMLSVRDERRTGTRAVFVTRDLGETWEEHPTSNKSLPDPVCQASILRVASVKDGDSRNLLAFFNPDSARSRVDLSLRLSEDEGNTWTRKELCYTPANWGYSSMCMIDKDTIGVLYETTGGLIFEKIKVDDVPTTTNP